MLTLKAWAKRNGSLEVFFARKFAPVISQSIIDQVDVLINSKNKLVKTGDDKMEVRHYQKFAEDFQHPSRTSYWQNMYHHLDNPPERDSAWVMEVKTLCLVAKDSLFETISKEYNFDKLQEVTSFHRNDVLQGILLKFSVRRKKDIDKHFEVLVQHKLNITHKTISFRQGEFRVGSDFDPKELVFRNLLNNINEHSEPVLMYTFNTAQIREEKDLTLKVAWMDPNGNVAYVNENSVWNAAVTNGTITPKLNSQMISGIWTILVLNKQTNTLLVRLSFLVFPTEKFLGHEKRKRHDLITIFNQTQTLQDKTFDKLNQFHSELSNDETVLWSKLLLKEFYSFVSVCCVISNKHINRTKKNYSMPSCENTAWSSLSPDPKSSISRFDEELGMLV